jgi:hypothetical protein
MTLPYQYLSAAQELVGKILDIRAGLTETYPQTVVAITYDNDTWGTELPNETNYSRQIQISRNDSDRWLTESVMMVMAYLVEEE